MLLVVVCVCVSLDKKDDQTCPGILPIWRSVCNQYTIQYQRAFCRWKFGHWRMRRECICLGWATVLYLFFAHPSMLSRWTPCSLTMCFIRPIWCIYYAVYWAWIFPHRDSQYHSILHTTSQKNDESFHRHHMVVLQIDRDSNGSHGSIFITHRWGSLAMVY